MSDDAQGKYVLLESFEIDNGELDGLSPQMCFVLGWELAEICRKAEDLSESWQVTMHAENRARVAHALAKRGRVHVFTWLPNDMSEGWLWLKVDAKSTGR